MAVCYVARMVCSRRYIRSHNPCAAARTPMTDEPTDPLFMNSLFANADLRAIEKDLEASPSVEDIFPPQVLAALMNMDDIQVSDADERLYEQIKTLAITPKTPEQKIG